MKTLFQKLSESALALADIDYTQEQTEKKWIGTDPASQDRIDAAEERLSVKLPEDYTEFLKVTNGCAPASAVEPGFASVDKIERLKNIYPDLVEAYTYDDFPEMGEALNGAIIVGGFDEDQHFLLIPPSGDTPSWRYWKFANWIPGEEEYESLKDYFESVIEFNAETFEEE